jgi:redox-sensitive bicupin YhaK (pirin superfamily)
MQVIGPDAEALGINADATISLGRVQQGADVTIDIATGRSAMIYVVEGSVALDGAELDRQDQVRVSGPVRLRVTGLEPADLLLIESAS